MDRNPKKPVVSVTGDGSTTLYSPKFDQHYHNPNGAVSESRIVFFETSGLVNTLSETGHFNIFEMGFGTGLNLILLKDYIERESRQINIDFYSVEAFPVDEETAENLEFGDQLSRHNPNRLLQPIFSGLTPGLNRFEITENLTLHLFIGTFDRMPDPKQKIDYLFHDPFSPDVNAELWTPAVFRRLHRFSSPKGVLTTYSAASKARAAMAVAGWKVARAPGALGKREMTIASPDKERLGGFKRVNEERLSVRYHQGDFS